ncbi:serine hydrolase [Sandarakinorhabdus sp.]|uniref:serine hydrolase domain-containing protein n=1 Tax=Sandarakinorhabdus sp. TaxID=1916663 RepID=UPI00286E6CA5|nr:serine hydrolase [Sandarakinorhabdus sp.]
MRGVKGALMGAAMAAATAHAAPPTATESDPVRLGLMQGFPVPADKQVRFDDASMWRFPNTRWAFSNMAALVPTVPIRRSGAVSPLPRATRSDIDAIPLKTLDGTAMTWRESLDAVYADGIVVLHRGRIIYERYLGALGPADKHLAMSVTKSFVGTITESLIAEGKLDPARTIASYVPELARSGFGDATLRQVLDMRTAIAFSEDYVPGATGLTDVQRMSIASGLAPRPPGYDGPNGGYALAASIPANGTHGGDFVYRTPNTMVLAWVIERITGQSVAAQIEARFWSKLGMEQDANLIVDGGGTAFAGGGMNASLRDMARFGEMIRLGGRWKGQQIVPAAVVEQLARGGDPATFAHTKYPGLDGGSYASQWWHRAGGQMMAMGVNGQGIYIDQRAELVIARFASHPVATNRAINPVTIPAYDALTAHLARAK